MRIPFELFTPDRTALIVIDKQRAYMDPEVLAERGKTLPDDWLRKLERMEYLIEQARESEMPIVWTQMTESLGASPAPIAEKIYIAGKAGVPSVKSAPGRPEYDFYGSVVPQSDELILPKKRYDSFSNPDLDETLRGGNISSVVLCGGFATRCVLATAFGANSHDYHVMVASDAIINPAQFENELSVGTSIIDAIIGYHATTREITGNWSS